MGMRKFADSTDFIDLSDHTVLPGLIDSHVHLTSDAGGLAGQLEAVTLSPAAQAINAQANGMKTLRAGFTTVRNLGDGDGAVFALRDAVNAGKVMGPRIIDAGSSLSGTAGHSDDALGYRDELRPFFAGAGNTCDGAEDCRRANATTDRTWRGRYQDDDHRRGQQPDRGRVWAARCLMMRRRRSLPPLGCSGAGWRSIRTAPTGLFRR